MGIKYWHDGQWKTLSKDKIKYWDGSQWVQITAIKYWHENQWKTLI